MRQHVKDLPGWLAQARHLLRPTPVKRDHIPLWVTQRLKKAAREGKFEEPPYASSRSRLLAAVESVSNRDQDDTLWMDHWGTTVLFGDQFFVSEPYVIPLEPIKRFSELLGLPWVLDANSWHYPGNTYRVLWFSPQNAEAMKVNRAGREVRWYSA